MAMKETESVEKRRYDTGSHNKQPLVEADLSSLCDSEDEEDQCSSAENSPEAITLEPSDLCYWLKFEERLTSDQWAEWDEELAVLKLNRQDLVEPTVKPEWFGSPIAFELLKALNFCTCGWLAHFRIDMDGTWHDKPNEDLDNALGKVIGDSYDHFLIPVLSGVVHVINNDDACKLFSANEKKYVKLFLRWINSILPKELAKFDWERKWADTYSHMKPWNAEFGEIRNCKNKAALKKALKKAEEQLPGEDKENWHQDDVFGVYNKDLHLLMLWDLAFYQYTKFKKDPLREYYLRILWRVAFGLKGSELTTNEQLLAAGWLQRWIIERKQPMYDWEQLIRKDLPAPVKKEVTEEGEGQDDMDSETEETQAGNSPFSHPSPPVSSAVVGLLSKSPSPVVGVPKQPQVIVKKETTPIPEGEECFSPTTRMLREMYHDDGAEEKEAPSPKHRAVEDENGEPKREEGETASSVTQIKHESDRARKSPVPVRSLGLPSAVTYSQHSSPSDSTSSASERRVTMAADHAEQLEKMMKVATQQPVKREEGIKPGIMSVPLMPMNSRRFSSDGSSHINPVLLTSRRSSYPVVTTTALHHHMMPDPSMMPHPSMMSYSPNQCAGHMYPPTGSLQLTTSSMASGGAIPPSPHPYQTGDGMMHSYSPMPPPGMYPPAPPQTVPVFSPLISAQVMGGTAGGVYSVSAPMFGGGDDMMSHGGYGSPLMNRPPNNFLRHGGYHPSLDLPPGYSIKPEGFNQSD